MLKRVLPDKTSNWSIRSLTIFSHIIGQKYFYNEADDSMGILSKKVNAKFCLGGVSFASLWCGFKLVLSITPWARL